MRKIKFRAWDSKNKYMLDSAYGDWISFDGVAYTQASYTHNTPNIEIEGAKDYTLMQYTGLKDKNGKEIYEGDICISTEEDSYCVETIRNGEILWNNEKAYFKIEYFDDSFRNMSLLHQIELEIIGNIHENPELKGEIE